MTNSTALDETFSERAPAVGDKAIRVAVRVDASRTIGGGHLMRCLTLAHTLREQGAGCVFLSRDLAGDMRSVIKESGFETVTLAPATSRFHPRDGEPDHAAWAEVGWEQDAAETAAALRSRVDWLILDHYAFDARWAEALRRSSKVSRILAIDDIDDRPLGADILLDQSRLPCLAPRRYGAPTSLVGPRFALLRPEFRRLRNASLSRRSGPLGAPPRLLISTGMMDIGGAALMATQALLRLDIAIDIAISAHAPSAAALRDVAGRHENVALHLDARNMAELMCAADLAIGAAGATTWERLCLGLPCITLTLAQNQALIAKGLEEMALSTVLGAPDDSMAATLVQTVTHLLADTTELRRSSRRGAEMCDGSGARRVAERLRDQPVCA